MGNNDFGVGFGFGLGTTCLLFLLCLQLSGATVGVRENDILLAQEVCQDRGVKWIDKTEFMCNDGATYDIKDLKERFNK